jgi:fungal STAND N-terminal Goodbye domain
MSSVTHTPQSNYQLILHALASYADQTSIDLSTNPLADKLQHSDLPDAILELLHDREKAFKEYREGNRKLINWLTPTVQVLHAFGGILGESLSLVSSTALIPWHWCHSSSSGPFPTSKSNLRWYRCSSCRAYPPVINQIPLMCNMSGCEQRQFKL